MQHRSVWIEPLISLALLLGVAIGVAHAQESSDRDRAIRSSQASVRVFPDDPVGYERLGAQYLQKGRETGDASYYDLAKQSFERSLDLYASDPRAARPSTQMAVVMMAEHRFGDAIDWAQRALGFGLGDSSPWAIVGDAYADLGEYDKAQDAYSKLVPDSGHSQDSPRSLVYERDARISYLRFIRGQTQDAILLMLAAIRTAVANQLPAENVAWSWYQLGEYFFQAGDLSRAEQAQQGALTTYPEYYRALAGLAKVRAAQGSLEEAAGLYERSIRVVPTAEYAANLGDVYARLGKQDDAQKNYDLVEFIGRLTALNQSLNNRELAQFYSDHDLKLDSALELAIRELEVRHDVYSLDILAWAYYKNGKLQEAAGAISRALSQGTRDALLFFHAGMIFEGLGDADKATEYLTSALDINPHFHIVYAAVASARLAELEKRSAETRPREQGNGR